MVPRKWSVAGIVIIALVTVTTLLLGAVGAINYFSTENRQWSRLNEELALSVDQLSTGLALAVWNLDDSLIEKIMESAMKNRSIYGIVLKTKENFIIRGRDEQWQIV
ncbi:MAG: hypothetical protein HQK55_13675, partial [Deltaproteobacteria bacterium]|nr:hypothetical protein [Deltaproteobacteria bacterium]